jgi:predicted AAA+ superfamily ATPase
MTSKEVKIPRVLEIDLPPRQSAFLWGPRKCGKTTLLKAKFKDSLYFDLLETDLYLDLMKRPAILRERLLAADKKSLALPIIIDEVQKIPLILDEVHALIENQGLSFILCGSSARKLRHGRANLLGGRAWRYRLLPLTVAEVESSGVEFDLLKGLGQGMIPGHYLTTHPKRTLTVYIHDYLKEEIQAEGLTRNLPAFSRFLDAVAFSHGEIINYSSIARACGVDSKTVREYFQILEDTLVAYRIDPYVKRRHRDVIISAPKFYLFDVGVAGSLCARTINETRGAEFGRGFEHLVLMELVAYFAYREIDQPISYWRTKSGLEVDFVLGDGAVAVEVKGTSQVDNRDLRSTVSFAEEYKPKKTFVVCDEVAKRRVGQVLIIPWREFLKELWRNQIFE